MGSYRIAQICLNGHIVTDSYDTTPQFREKFCTKCGSKTIISCPNCSANIRGDYESDTVCYLGSTMHTTPAYCYNCGQPYPWTKSALESARLLINEDENLSQIEKQQFSESLPDLLVESPTPKTKVAVVRFKKFLGKAATYTAEGIRDIFVDVTSETIKKSLGL
ncbi:DUF2321 domain-containing protein [Clostridium botulinum]|uniref:DUF2321 domain-containing protein n=1 Tax=Clostridium botulinum (strain 657 / Type Ba4) TaxID=515621 RepID=A0A3F3AC95_CLOB6|nr:MULTISPECIES: DUF2321 domain-containing protein [Clostridium]ACQ53499.1 conserved hypothetical protein [Clostridium botulinum Ba4 str. 657]APU60204.1 hypothetical protein NPD8_2162 [Clostridium botulinum]AXG91501.1 DUF2321 domain-containing protein [Clostridium botulinum]NEZ80694.1 DUF2321 domain-containing protein [Clostridium botulinum]NFA18090.1 DUF2321 domain-containing protein [Clostridium botulinum]